MNYPLLCSFFFTLSCSTLANERASSREWAPLPHYAPSESTLKTPSYEDLLNGYPNKEQAAKEPIIMRHMGRGGMYYGCTRCRDGYITADRRAVEVHVAKHDRKEERQRAVVASQAIVAPQPKTARGKHCQRERKTKVAAPYPQLPTSMFSRMPPARATEEPTANRTTRCVYLLEQPLPIVAALRRIGRQKIPNADASALVCHETLPVEPQEYGHSALPCAELPLLLPPYPERG